MATDNLTATSLVVNPASLSSATFSYIYTLVGNSLTLNAPVLSAGAFKSLSPRSLSIQSPVIGLGAFARNQAGLVAASLAVGSLKRGRCLGTPRLVLNFAAPRQILAPDRHVRRGGDSYAVALSNLLPVGLAWPREPSTLLMRIVSGLAQVWGNWVDRRAADLLEQETDPRKTLEMLPDWERNWGLPDPCFAEASTIDQRRQQLLLKMTLLGGQSRDFFIFISFAWLGQHILITEYAPFMCGISEVGDTRDDQGDYRWQIGPPEMRFYWTVHVDNARLTWFRASAGQAGVDPHLRIGLAVDLECLLRRWKPAHTDLVFDSAACSAAGRWQEHRKED